LNKDELDDWYKAIEETIQPPDESYTAWVEEGSTQEHKTKSGASGRDISYEQINRGRQEIIDWYESKGLHDQAVELRQIAGQWRIIHEEYQE
jgi:hypothetical protein